MRDEHDGISECRRFEIVFLSAVLLALRQSFFQPTFFQHCKVSTAASSNGVLGGVSGLIIIVNRRDSSLFDWCEIDGHCQCEDSGQTKSEEERI